jgi:glycosyltransferase involved in cell wall biosynthesis
MVPPVKKCKYIVTTHDVIFEDYPEEFTRSYRLTKKLMYRHGAKLADILTTVSEFSRQSIEKHLGIPKGKTVIIPNGVSERFFKPYDKKNSKAHIFLRYGIGRHILYVSRFEPRKNHAGLLKAWLDLELYKQGIWLVMLGHRSLRVEAFDKMIGSLPDSIRSFIYMDDSVGDEDLLEFYRSADLFVYPSKAEGFGISPLEAAALKVPVICSNSSAMSAFTFFNEGHINTSDQSLLQQTMERMLALPASASELENIAARIRQEFSWDDVAEMFYQQLLQQKIVTSLPKRVHNDQLPVS